MSSIQQFYELPENARKEVLDFIDFLAYKNGVESKQSHIEQKRTKWLKKVDRPVNTSGELISDTVRRLRDEEKW
ncbi:MAG: DUF2281 domain-containing protein [Spirochaetales bacterium]|nr:DUF2281 domain-containing protein [Spirochaetales bacterium]